MNLESGIYVVEVIKNSSAEKAGIKKGDIIQKIDGVTLNKMSELRKYIYTKTPGEEITLLIQRNGITSPVKVTLGKK
ncbi:PDZ domain-containing protein [Thomasclavelia cocleata]|uniref:PDZ domain-containing protein n=1 Tax=Thomasclavelia cocleata TaxID=69824 RepID=UPI00272E87A6|nr:PDZ domain-containing protein [Thomasclavelia cocleata]